MTIMPQDFFSDDLVEDFVASGYEKLNRLEESLALQSSAGKAAFVRELHSLKGNAQTYGLKELADLCHRAEDALSQADDWSEAQRMHLALYLAHIEVGLGQLSNA